MTLRNLFTPDLRPPLALLHPMHILLGIHELGTNVDKFDGRSASSTTIWVHDFRRTIVREIRGYITRLNRPLGPPMSFRIFTCPFQDGREDRLLNDRLLTKRNKKRV